MPEPAESWGLSHSSLPLSNPSTTSAPLLPLVPSQNSAWCCESPADNRVITPADNQDKGKRGGGFIFSWTSNLSPIQLIKWPDRHEHWRAYCFSQLHSKQLAPPGKSHTSRRAGLPGVAFVCCPHLKVFREIHTWEGLKSIDLSHLTLKEDIFSQMHINCFHDSIVKVL